MLLNHAKDVALRKIEQRPLPNRHVGAGCPIVRTTSPQMFSLTKFGHFLLLSVPNDDLKESCSGQYFRIIYCTNPFEQIRVVFCPNFPKGAPRR